MVKCLVRYDRLPLSRDSYVCTDSRPVHILFYWTVHQSDVTTLIHNIHLIMYVLCTFPEQSCNLKGIKRYSTWWCGFATLSVVWRTPVYPLTPTPSYHRHARFNRDEFQQSAGRPAAKQLSLMRLIYYSWCSVQWLLTAPVNLGCCDSGVTVHLYGSCAVRHNLL